MADNTPQNGTASIAADDVTTLNGAASSGVLVQRVKNAFGDDGTARDVSTAFPLPTSTPNTLTTGNLTAANANPTTGTPTAGSTLSITIPDSHSAWTVQFGGTFSAGTLVSFQGSIDGITWFALNGRRNTDAATNDLTNFISADASGGASPTGSNPSMYRGVLGGIRFFRVSAAPFTAADNVAVSIYTSAGVGPTFLNNVPEFRQLFAGIGTAGTASGNINEQYRTGTTAQATNATFIAAPAAGLSIYVTDMEGSNEGATSTRLSFMEGATTTPTYARFMASAGGGFVTNLKTPWKLPAATALSYQVSAATTWHATINFYVAP